MDARCQCGSCDFEFFSGHSHHVGTQSALCSGCLAEYELVTKSYWGPGYDEVIPVHRVTPESVKHRGRHKNEPSFRKKSVPTGQEVMAVTHSSGRGVVISFVDELQCIECKERGRIVLYFGDRDPCPKCRQGTLRCEEVLY